MQKENKFKKIFKNIGAFFDKIIFPKNIKCIFCGKDIDDFENQPYCDDCEKDLEFNNGNRCLICAEPIDEDVVCYCCKTHKRNFKKAFCPFVYSKVVRKAILAYKDSNRRYLAETFAKYIAKSIKDSGVEIDYITFVPLTKKKEKSRSFNQSKLLAEEVAKILDVKVVSLFEKTNDKHSQKTANYFERQANMIGLYSLVSDKLEENRNYLIVDDVITTGATMNYCAGLLNKSVKNVYVCAIARNKKRLKSETEGKNIVPKREYY